MLAKLIAINVQCKSNICEKLNKIRISWACRAGTPIIHPCHLVI